MGENNEMLAAVQPWLAALYESGAATLSPTGAVNMNPEVRNLFSAIHAVLAGGEVKLEVVDTGGAAYATLESHMDRAIGQVGKLAAELGGADGIAPMGA
ncbi:MAG: hypothetical protein QNJ97_08295 [Myxococcota bacterium]|nr:hypothetical protein [Myxococcota bacterium]